MKPQIPEQSSRSLANRGTESAAADLVRLARLDLWLHLRKFLVKPVLARLHVDIAT